MAKSAIDCHFYLTGSCRNGDSCPFRHSEGARTTQEECEEFSALGQCSSHDCGKRHSETKRTKPPSEVQCRNEESGTCTRVGCIFKHTGQRAQLNARAKAFVPRGAQGSRMEWTPESSISNVQSGSFGNKEWTPRAHTESNQPAFGNMEWVPNAAPQSQSFGNKELTPAANAKPAMTQAFGNKEWTPAGVPKPTMTQAFGNKEWTPAAATETAPKPKFGNKEWTPAAAAKPAPKSAFVLSFAEIMERKRRRNTTTEQPTEQPKKDTVTTEVKRPKVTNYVDLFERELAELNKELSGPLENTPESDRISRASLGEAIEYI
ncbi:hypothetical protein J3F80_000536 [Coemansia sp. RSA 2526]|nr:hypothetical protein J3F80_000536 [Coemansia sp. RSA 2526]